VAPASPQQVVFAAALAGMVAGLAYTLSPSTVLALAALSVVIAWAATGLSPRQRRWFLSIVIVGLAVRLTVIALLFLTADPAIPFATLFGDEQFFKNRTVWMRNVGLGLPMSPADIIYAFEDVGVSSYLYVLAFLQALVGTVPYGIHVLNAAAYVIGVVLVYRLVRPVYGGVAALAGLALLLFFPSLFVWSISALKEPSYTLVAVIELLCALYVVRGRLWWHRAAAVAGVIAAAFALDSLRRGGLAVASVGAVTGLAVGLAATRPRVALAGILAIPAVVLALLFVPPVHDRMMQVVRRAAVYHGGHITSEGYSYKILEGRYYWDGRLLYAMPPREAGAFVVRSVISYVTEPVPWRSESRAMRAYLPEQMLWYVVLAFVPFGFVAGMRREPVLTSLIAAHAAAIVMMVALTSGNIGTLIRHRGLVLPYVAWLAALGLCHVVTRFTPAPSQGRDPHAHR
jgi:hypothetical protein